MWTCVLHRVEQALQCAHEASSDLRVSQGRTGSAVCGTSSDLRVTQGPAGSAVCPMELAPL